MPYHTTNETSVRRIEPVTGHKFFLLFLFLLAYLVMYPYVGETGMRYYVFRLASAALTLMCVYAVSFRKGLIFAGLIFAVPAIVAHTIVFLPRMVPTFGPQRGAQFCIRRFHDRSYLSPCFCARKG